MGDLLARQIQRMKLDVRDVCGGRNKFPEGELVLLDPFAIGLLDGELLLDFAVVFQLTGGGVCRKHLAGPEAAFADDGRIVKNHGTGFGADVEDPICGDFVAGWAETIAIERGAEFRAIGEDQAGGAIPWLGEGADETIEGAEVFRDILIVAIGGRNKHAHGVLGRATR